LHGRLETSPSPERSLAWLLKLMTAAAPLAD
jgi:hypothetical protein